MAGYGSFAFFYDELTENVDHAGWADYLLKLFRTYGAKPPKTVLDLACGTGSLACALLEKGVDVIGVDGSEDMLAEAMDKGAPFGDRLMLLCQDMRELDLFGTVDGAVCMLDSLNHLLKTEDVGEVFRRLGLFIEKDGLFIFDVNTPYKHETVLGDNAFIYEQDDFLCAWQNHYMPRTKEVAIQLDFFVNNGEGYDRYTEEIRERAYTEKTLRRLLSEAGFKVLGVFEERTEAAPSETAQRVVFVTKNLGLKQR